MGDEERPAWVDDKLSPFESRFVAIDGHTVHDVDEGSGPTLLLLHGNPTWSFVYREVIRALRDECRCIALDYPGFGLSTPRPDYRYLPEEHAQVVTAFVDAVGLTGVTLFVNAFIPAGHRLRKPTATDMTQYRMALATLDRREAAAVLPRRITASRDFLGDVEAGLPPPARGDVQRKMPRGS